ncbi:conjugal transfer protein MobB [Parabacteroides distasonis]|uniref:conjugal transfer protein MobB n=1 Tax=Parabacteroides distasonis TaxID=823 RepID=UPI001C3D4CA6|nr:conjugal transfer protein MobB [Parabacteroides distasonis]MCR1851938.1 relaxase/mobilization nuclease domain-containing protein [Parabacteroides distasonis]
MVAKISLGSSLYGAIAYNGEKINKEKGRVLDTNKIFNDGSGTVNIRRAYDDFLRWMPSATRTEKPMMHISLNPHPDDRLSDTDFTRLAHEYMEKMGFTEMPYLIVKHEDIDRHHVHIVALRVGTDGRCISDSNNFYRSKNICRELEKKYGLKPAEREKITPDMPIRKVAPSGDIKRQVANTVKMVGMRYKFQTIGKYNAILSLYNVRCEQTDGRVNGREYHGLVYFATDDSGKTIATPFKASRLGKFASRTAIDGRFERAKDKIDVAPTKRKVADIMVVADDKSDFIAKLKERNIDVVLRYTDEGRIYGVTFIDHNTMTVLNGSRLGKEFSANAINERFNNPANVPTDTPDVATPIVAPMVEPTPEYTGSDNQSQTDTEQHTQSSGGQHQSTVTQSVSDFGDYDLPIPGLDLFQQGQSFNPDEEEFRRRMQRKKKKGRRPKF